MAVEEAAPKREGPVGSLISRMGFAKAEEFAKKLGILSGDADSLAGWPAGVAGINWMLGTGGVVAVVGTAVTRSWLATPL